VSQNKQSSTKEIPVSPNKMRIGFVGVGGMGQMAHLRNYATLEDCEVAAIAEVRPETAKLVAARYGVPKVYHDHREMLAKERLDGVVASQPFDLHATLLPEIYPHVKCVFTEKPLAVGVEAGQKLAAAAAETKCTHMVGYHKRSDPATTYAKGLVDQWRKSGTLGAMKYVRITMPAGDWVANGFVGLLNAGDQPTGAPTKREMDNAWGAPGIPGMDAESGKRYVEFVNYYIHQVNLMRHLLGEPYRISFADKSGVLLVAEGSSGVCGTIEMTPYRTTIEWEETALVGFEKGYVLLRLPAPLAHNRCGTVEVYEDPGDGRTPLRSSPTLPWVHAMRQQAANFIKVCRGEIQPPCDAVEAVEDLKNAREYVRLRFGR
jgi:predicted dehydrogenase